MNKEILVDANKFAIRVAVVEDGTPVELYVEQTGTERLVGNIYLGKLRGHRPREERLSVRRGRVLPRGSVRRAGAAPGDSEDRGSVEAWPERAGPGGQGPGGHQGRPGHHPHHPGGALPGAHAHGGLRGRQPPHREGGRAGEAPQDPQRDQAQEQGRHRPHRLRRKDQGGLPGGPGQPVDPLRGHRDQVQEDQGSRPHARGAEPAVPDGPGPSDEGRGPGLRQRPGSLREAQGDRGRDGPQAEAPDPL